MIELQDDALIFRFPEVHPDARLKIGLMRTVRVPDDGGSYPLPPGFRRFPVRHLDDYAPRVPDIWLKRGGVIVPMYQSEALWLQFDAKSVSGRGHGGGPFGEDGLYPFAIKVASGKINAVTGEPWRDGLNRRPRNYVAAPEQRWLDGFVVSPGRTRQFVAMPLGAGYSAEEQLTAAAEFGGLQIQAYPMRREVFERRYPGRGGRRSERVPDGVMCEIAPPSDSASASSRPPERRPRASMGLSPGGRLRQKVYPDAFDFSDWDAEHSSRCFVHLANSLIWRQVTGENPPPPPLTAREYEELGLPWFEAWDEELEALSGGPALQGVKSVAELGREKHEAPLPENDSVEPGRVVNVRVGWGKQQVREEEF